MTSTRRSRLSCIALILLIPMALVGCGTPCESCIEFVDSIIFELACRELNECVTTDYPSPYQPAFVMGPVWRIWCWELCCDGEDSLSDPSLCLERLFSSHSPAHDFAHTHDCSIRP